MRVIILLKFWGLADNTKKMILKRTDEELKKKLEIDDEIPLERWYDR